MIGPKLVASQRPGKFLGGSRHRGHRAGGRRLRAPGGGADRAAGHAHAHQAATRPRSQLVAYLPWPPPPPVTSPEAATGIEVGGDW